MHFFVSLSAGSHLYDERLCLLEGTKIGDGRSPNTESLLAPQLSPVNDDNSGSSEIQQWRIKRNM